MGGVVAEQKPHIQQLIKAITSTTQWKEANREVGNQIDVLTAESEALIDMPNSDSPEIKAKRKVVADNINYLLEMQEEINAQMMDIELAEMMIRNASEADVEKAEGLVREMIKDAHSVSRSPSGLN